MAGDCRLRRGGDHRWRWSCARTSSSWTSTCPAWTAWQLPRSSRSGCRPAPIIMMSVHGEAEQLKRSISAGAREFLVKPFSADEFSTSIRQRLRARARAPRAGRRRPCRRRHRRRRWSGRPGRAPGHRRLLAQGRGRTDDHRHQPGAGPAARDRGTGLPGRRQPPVRRRRRPPEPEPQESARSLDAVDGGEPDRDIIDSVVDRPLDRHPRPAGAAVTGGRRPRDARLPAQDGRHPARAATTSW